ncbi:MAG: PAS domain-containing protein [Halobacteria archaeon]
MIQKEIEVLLDDLEATDDEKLPSNLRGRAKEIREKQAEKREIKRTREFLMEIQKVAGIGGWEIDLGDQDLIWTEEVYEIHELPKSYSPTVEEGIGFYHPDDRETIRENVEGAIERGESYDDELRLITAEEDVKWVRAKGKPVYTDGEITAVRGTFQDITDRKEREQELRRAKNRLDMALSGTNNGVWEWIPDTGELILDETLREMFGYSGDEFADSIEEYEDYIDPDDLEKFKRKVREVIEEESDHKGFELDYRVETKDGEERWHHSRAKLLDTEGRRLIGITEDMTERKRREKRLEEMTEDLKLVNQVMRHDVRNDMNVIRNGVEYLKSEESLKDEELVEAVVNSTEDVIELTESIRIMVNSIAKENEAKLEPIDLNSCLNNQIDNVEDQYDCSIEQRKLPEVPVLGDEMTSNLFKNILTNAVEHNPRDDKKILVYGEEKKDAAEVVIADNGEGLSKHVKDIIFSRKEWNYSSPKTGFGLYLVEKLVDRYGGEVWVEDNDALNGAEFHVKLKEAEE